MCGIAGIVDYDAGYMDTAIVKDMIETMNHRGPDGEGVYSNTNVLLGHKRLSIIDVEGSKQPLCNEDESIWITFNGEIYNYPDLRKKLIARGHRFRTSGDTETLVHLYEDYGSEMVNHLQGMFAFAIWDVKKQTLFLARDRIGIKPLYYCNTSSSFLFASEIKALLQHREVKASYRHESVWHYLTYRSVPAPDTLFENIYKLKPGHTLTVTRDGCYKKLYWDIPLSDACDLPAAYEKYRSEKNHDTVTDEVEELLLKSVKRRLISDVPLGAFLSGGVDSSLIVAMMSKLTGAQVKTYSVGFENFAFSETPYAKTVSDLYKTDHHELILGEDFFADNLEKATWMRDKPLSEPADVPLHLLAKMASQDVKVLLSGEGSDELFAGYPKYSYDRFAPMLSWMPGAIVSGVGKILPSKLRRAEVAMKSLSEKNRIDRWAQWFAPFSKSEKRKLFGDGSAFADPIVDYAFIAGNCSDLDAMLYVDCKLWLPENLLERGDRMTMGASVESRVPFLDHELIEHAFGLPADVKIKGFSRKWQIKQIARKYLPDSIIDRRKVGFSLPLDQWFRGKLRDMCYDRVCSNDGICRDIFNRQMLQKILDDHTSCAKDNSKKIWTLLTLSIWDDVFCSKSNSVCTA
jgi:asparagine synthase (glutamine-hydrolysing)